MRLHVLKAFECLWSEAWHGQDQSKVVRKALTFSHTIIGQFQQLNTIPTPPPQKKTHLWRHISHFPFFHLMITKPQTSHPIFTHSLAYVTVLPPAVWNQVFESWSVKWCTDPYQITCSPRRESDWLGRHRQALSLWRPGVSLLTVLIQADTQQRSIKSDCRQSFIHPN